MQELCEGVEPFEMALITKELIEKNSQYFTVEDLNSIICKWNYGKLDVENKPTTIPSAFGNTIKAQCWLNLVFTTFVSSNGGSSVPSSDLHWQFLFNS